MNRKYKYTYNFIKNVDKKIVVILGYFLEERKRKNTPSTIVSSGEMDRPPLNLHDQGLSMPARREIKYNQYHKKYAAYREFKDDSYIQFSTNHLKGSEPSTSQEFGRREPNDFEDYRTSESWKRGRFDPIEEPRVETSNADPMLRAKLKLQQVLKLQAKVPDHQRSQFDRFGIDSSFHQGRQFEDLTQRFRQSMDVLQKNTGNLPRQNLDISTGNFLADIRNQRDHSYNDDDGYGRHDQHVQQGLYEKHGRYNQQPASSSRQNPSQGNMFPHHGFNAMRRWK